MTTSLPYSKILVSSTETRFIKRRKGVERTDSKIVGGVRNEFLKMRSYAICKLKNEFALISLLCLSASVSSTGDSYTTEENNSGLS